MRRQILARLIEERVVLAFAARHHISLSPRDRVEIGAQVAHLSASGSPSAMPGIGIPFIRGVLTRQAVIQEVERVVTPARLTRGPSVHLVVYSIPSNSGRGAYKEALTLATNGEPVPAAARQKDEWVARFHVPPWIDSTLAAASRGQYLGPFRRHGAILVYRLLNRGVHRYSGPARARVEARYFSGWLKRELAHRPPSCYASTGKAEGCPGPR